MILYTSYIFKFCQFALKVFDEFLHVERNIILKKKKIVFEYDHLTSHLRL